VMFYVIELIDM